MSHFLVFTFLGVFAIGNHPSATWELPKFGEPIPNITVVKGRDAVLSCKVENLAGFRVGWVRADSKAIQAIHTHVITHNPRVSVSHSDHSMWHLHIKGVKEEDRGSYMCQINTDPMISQVSFLEVVIPPDFIPEDTSGDVMAPEGSTVKLQCNARGHPKPSIVWKRESDQNITLKANSGSKTQVSVFEGNVLRLAKISRADMGPYLCIASNGVPPSISKRILVSVHFHPVIQVPNQLVGAPINTDVTLECNVEAFPRSIHFWMKENGAMIITGDRFEVKEVVKSMFEVKMILTIRKFRRSDAGSFHCIAKNSLGDVDSVVKLHVIKMPVESTQSNAEMFDEDDPYYDTGLDSVSLLNGRGEVEEIVVEGEAGGGYSSHGGGHHHSGGSGGLTNNYTPGGSLQNNRHSTSNNGNNGRHSKKAASGGSPNSKGGRGEGGLVGGSLEGPSNNKKSVVLNNPNPSVASGANFILVSQLGVLILCVALNHLGRLVGT